MNRSILPETSDSVPPSRARKIALWLWSGAALVFLMVVVGGITRLTGSGLSMTDWNLIMGAIPPMGEAQWLEAFEQYKQFPEYQMRNTGMSLEAFKAIFFWEYLHRLLGRFIGLVFLAPFLFFWLRSWFTPRLLRRTLLLFGLGALQAAMGWFMVKSGLADVPYVSHYRLAVHLVLAFALTGLCAWYALDLRPLRRAPGSPGEASANGESGERPGSPLASLKTWALAVGSLFALQVIWGAFTAGLDAGFMYNTFPKMGQGWLPRDGASLEPFLLNLFENPGTVQFVHRLLGTVLAAAVGVLWWKSRPANDGGYLARPALLLAALVVLQYLLGVLTVLHQVPVALGVAHQAVALLFWVAWLLYYRRLNEAADMYGWVIVE